MRRSSWTDREGPAIILCVGKVSRDSSIPLRDTIRCGIWPMRGSYAARDFVFQDGSLPDTVEHDHSECTAPLQPSQYQLKYLATAEL